MELLLVAAKRDQINDFAQLARNAKLKPVVCDIDAFTVQNLFEHSRGLPAEQTVALINVGASLASLNVIAGGVSAFTREITTGGNAITEEIQKQLGVPYDQAEAYKCSGSGPGQSPATGMIPEQAIRIIESVTDSIAGEIQRSLDFFQATTGEGEISRIFVTGGTANLAPLAQAIERRARVPVEVWSPTERIVIETTDASALLIQARAAQFAVALGLALRKDREARS
jgi:type IV pilus assembly protein PilM